MPLLKRTIENVLKVYAHALIKRRRPLVVGVTGSIGKTSTKEAIATVLASRWSVRQSQKNYNNELGVPLTILGLESGGRSIGAWLGILTVGFFRAFFGAGKYSQVLVLELGVDRPGDMDPLLYMARPTIGVVTTIGPSHLEFFDSVNAIAKEKGKLVRSLGPRGFAVLNYDDQLVKDLANTVSAEVLTYGFKEGASVRGLINPEGLSLDSDRWLDSPAEGRVGLNFKISSGGNIIPVRLASVGLPQAYAALAAAAVGQACKLNLVEIATALHQCCPLPGRVNLGEGGKKTLIIDDTYNSAPVSAISALSYLQSMKGSGRKIAVLGDMTELGIYTEEGHREVGKRAAEAVDILVTIGRRAKFMADAARAAGISTVKEFDHHQEAEKYLESTLQSYDMVLVKASQAIRLEKVVKEIMAKPEEAETVLVRQSKRWQEI